MSRDILLSLIDPDPEQPRKIFDAGALAELAASIGASGLAVPILLRPAGDRFAIVHGERRFRAVQALGWSVIPAEVRDLAPEEVRWLALAENVQRQDLAPTEEARAFQAILDTGTTQAELGRRLGKSQSYIATKLRFLKIPADVQELLDAGRLTEGHVKQLLRLAKAEQQSELARDTETEGWPVQRLKGEVDALLFYQAESNEGKTVSGLTEFAKRAIVVLTGKRAALERMELQLKEAETIPECLTVARQARGLEYEVSEVTLHLQREAGKYLAALRTAKESGSGKLQDGFYKRTLQGNASGQ